MVFGFLASLATPFLKPIAETAWEGIKKIGRDLFAEGKEKLGEVAQSAITTLGQTITDKATTIGQMSKRDKPISSAGNIQDEQLQTKAKILQSQEINYPSINPDMNPQRISQISGLYQNRYPTFQLDNREENRFQNIQSQNFRNRNTIQRYGFNIQKRKFNDLYPNGSFSFGSTQKRIQPSGIPSIIQQAMQQPTINFGGPSDFERIDNADNFDYEN